MSKYKAPWKEFDLNKDFWTEVLLGRRIESFGPDKKTVKVAGDQDPMVFIKRMTLDSKERVWLSEDAIILTDPVGKTITALAWGEKGIDALLLDDGSCIDLADQGWRICIQD